MDVVENATDIPVGYSGHCYVKNDRAQYYLLSKTSFAQYQLHREGGPAVVYDNGAEVWYKHGMFHRLDGPACKLKNGDDFRCEYWINGVNYSVESYWNHPLVAEYKLKSILEDKGS